MLDHELQSTTSIANTQLTKMNSLKRKLLMIVAGTLIFNILLAQNQVEMADNMRADGKIYVVVAVACIVFAVITVYLITTDRKISKIEKSMRNK